MMHIVIIEDEPLTAQDLSDILLQAPGPVTIQKVLPSVAEAVAYFREENPPDLVFSDIQLGDGDSFEIFRQVKIDCPVIFCTAYHEFALEAFRSNGIDYVLKPFSALTINAAVEKYHNLRLTLTRHHINYTGLFSSPAWAGKNQGISSLLINWKDKIIPVKYADIALFTIEYKTTQVVTFDNQKYYINQTLEELEQSCGPGFYRANRQYLVNRESIQEATQYFARKLVLKLKIEGKYEVIISKNKVPEFLNWLSH